MKRTSTILAVALLAPALAAAQFGGFKKLGNVIPGRSSPSNPEALAQGNDLAAYILMATDQGMMAVQEIASIFPEERVIKVKELAAKYNEAKADRKEGDFDTTYLTIAAEASAEMAKLEDEWKSYKKEKSGAVRKADARLGLMLLVDGIAATQVSPVVEGLRSEMKSLASNPTKATQLTSARRTAVFLTTASKQMPSQVKSFQTVRTIAKNVAGAEKFELAQDPSADSVKTVASLQVRTKLVE